MPTESILFTPTIDERELDKETDAVNEQLQGVGEDVPVSFDGDMDGLAPAGAGGGGSDRGGFSKYETASLGLMERTLKWQRQSAVEDTERNKILENWGSELTTIRERIGALGGVPEADGGLAAGGGGGGGVAGQAGLLSMSNKIPKPVSGVLSSAAIPMAITGGVGVKMLSAMHSSSAHMQTSSRLLGIAADNFFREPGRIFDEFIYRPLSDDILDMSLQWDEGLRMFSTTLGDGVIPDSFESAGTRLEGLGDALQGFPLKWVQLLGRGFERLGKSVSDFSIPEFTWPDLPDWPTITAGAVIGGITWPSLAGRAIAGAIGWPTLTVDDVLGYLTGDDSTGNGGTGSNGNGGVNPPAGLGNDQFGGGGGGSGAPGSQPLTPMQTGGRVRRTGAALVHRDELVTDEERLVSELASAVSQATGGGTRARSGGVDTSDMERKLDELNRNVRRLANSLSVDGLGPEEIARLSSSGTRDGIADSNPRV